MIRFTLLLAAVLSGFGFFSCTKDPVIENQEELITTVEAVFSPEGAGQNVTYSFFDEDGNGGKSPVISASGNLISGLPYKVTVRFGNAAVVPFQDITSEIQTEAEDHQVFYVFGAGLQESVTQEYLDRDTNGLPLGLSARMTPKNAGDGTLTIMLRHLPDKKAAGVSAGNPANAGGETDVEVVFPVRIQ